MRVPSATVRRVALRQFVAFLRSAVVTALVVTGLHFHSTAPWWLILILGIVSFLAFADGRLDGMTRIAPSTTSPLSDMTDQFNHADINRIRAAEGKLPTSDEDDVT